MQIVVCSHQYLFKHMWNDIPKKKKKTLKLIYETCGF
jgi:hypothetical protein